MSDLVIFFRSGECATRTSIPRPSMVQTTSCVFVEFSMRMAYSFPSRYLRTSR